MPRLKTKIRLLTFLGLVLFLQASFLGRANAQQLTLSPAVLNGYLVKTPALEPAEFVINNYLIIQLPYPDDHPQQQAALARIRFFQNILSSHWNIKGDLINIAQYQDNLINNYDAVVVVGDYPRKLPLAFINDLAQYQGRLAWFGSGVEIYLSLHRLPVAPLPIYNPSSNSTIFFDNIDFTFRQSELNAAYFLSPEELFGRASAQIKLAALSLDKNVFLRKAGQPLLVSLSNRTLLTPLVLPYEYSHVFLTFSKTVNNACVSNMTKATLKKRA